MAITLGNLVTTLILVSMIGVGVFVTINEAKTNYDIVPGADFNDTFDEFQTNFDSIVAETTNIQNTSQGVDASQTSTSGFNTASAIASFKLFFNFIGFIENLIIVSANVIGIQPFWIFGLLAIITIIITLIFLRAVFGVDV